MTKSVVLRNVIELNAALIARGIVRLASAVVLLSRLGLEGYGRLSYALTLSLTFVLMGDLGLPAYASRSAAREEPWYREQAASLLAMQLCLGGLRYLVMV